MSRKLSIVASLCAASICVAVASVGPVLAADSQRWGFVNTKGKMVISPEYREARAFADGLAAVRENVDGKDRWGFIDTNGVLLDGKALYKDVGDFSEGLAAVRLAEDDPNLEQYGKESAGKWGWIDKSGSFVIQPQFEESVGLFSDGLATVVKNGKYGYINKKGKWVIPPQFDLACRFSNGRAAVLVKENRGYLSLRTAGDMYRADGGHWNYIDKKGKVVFGAFDECGVYEDGVAPVAVGKNQSSVRPDKWGFVNRKGRFVIPPRFQDVHAMSEDKAAVQTGVWMEMGKGIQSWLPGKWGYIDKRGKQIIESKFDRADPFSEGLASVELNGKWGYIDPSGKLTIKPQFLSSWGFKNGLAPVLVNQDPEAGQ